MSADSMNGNDTTLAQPESFRARSLGASLTVGDLAKSVAWYCDVLGFSIDRKHERDGNVVATSVKAGDVRFVLNQDDGAKGIRAKGQGMSFYVETAQEIDGVADRIKAAGGALDTEPADMPWGVRMFRITDPDGFKFAISSPRPTA